MAIQRYNHTINQILGGGLTMTNLQAMLLDEDATFVASHTTVNQVSNTGAYSVGGNGWTAAGMSFAGEAYSIVDTDDAMFDLDNLSVTASGGSIGPASAVLLFIGTVPLFFQAFDTPQEAGNGTPFLININANGLFRVVG